MSDSMTASVLAFAAVAAALVLTPGVGTAYLMSTVVTHGRRAGYLTASGMVIGAAIHAVLAAIGTSLLLRVFPDALRWIAIIGGAYIIWLGARNILRAIRSAPVAEDELRRSARAHSFVTTGMLIALGNAPLPLFYIVVVPQYVPRGVPRLAGAALLSAIHLAMAGAWMATLVRLVGRMVEVLRQPGVLAALQVVTGILLILLGIRSVAGTA